MALLNLWDNLKFSKSRVYILIFSLILMLFQDKGEIRSHLLQTQVSQHSWLPYEAKERGEKHET